MSAKAMAVLAWTAAWLLPWQAPLDALPGLRCALALAVFCVPGYCLYLLLGSRTPTWLASSLPVGLVFSSALTGTLGLAGSVLHLPTRVVGIGLWLAGSIGIWLLPREAFPSGRSCPGPDRRLWLDGAMLLVVILVTARLCVSPVMGADDMTYVARLTWFQQTPTLSFRGIVFGGDLPISPRDWLAFWPLSQATVAALAGVHGLQLTTHYLGPLLAPFAVLAVYGLARAIGLSRRDAVASAALQTAVLLLLAGRDQPGRQFFERLTEDKFVALYLFTPVAARLSIAILGGGGLRACLALGIGWLGIALVHPTALGIAFLILGAFCLLELIAGANRSAILALAILVPIAAGAASVRFIPSPTRHQAYFGIDDARRGNALTGARERRVEILEDSRFFGISKRAAPTPLRLAGALILALAITRVRRERVARYVAASAGVAVLAIVPYTGWLLAKLLTPFHLWRILAAVPFGIGLTFGIGTAVAWLVRGAEQPRRVARRIGSLASILAVAVLLVVAGVAAANPRVFRLASLDLRDGWQDRLDARAKLDFDRSQFTIADLLAMARALDDAITDRAVVLGEPGVNNLIPSLSAEAILVAFRSPAQTALHSGMGIDRARQEWHAYQDLVRGRLTPRSAMEYLRARNVRYVLTSSDAPWLASVDASTLPRRSIARAGPLTLYEIAAP